MVLVAAAPAGATASTGSGVSYTLEGCRASITAYLGTNDFRCQDALYTTGNLGKGWNEFDLVPGRVTLTAGNSAPSSQDYQFVIGVDNCSNDTGAAGCTLPGRPGYDRLSSNTGGVGPQFNTGHSTGSCGTVTWGAPQFAVLSGRTTLYRVVSVVGQAKNSTCVYDFYGRLAFNSHLYPGSSLHYNLLNTDLGTAGIGSKDVSIPVSAILPPTFTKSQDSTVGSNVNWTVSKESTPATINFPNTCDGSAATTAGVTVTVTWTKNTVSADDVTVTGHISLTNNAHREIDMSVSDQLYNGSSATSGNENTNSTPPSPIVTDGTSNSALNMAAGASASFSDVFSVPTGTATSFSDKATATYTDPVFDNVLGTDNKTASSSVETLDPTSGATATIADSESMTGSSDFDFTVDSRTGTLGTFSNYTVGDHTTGPVNWSSGTVTDSGSTSFSKTVYVNQATTGTATLADTATLTPTGQSATQDSASSTITGGAQVSLKIDKTIPVVLGTGDSAETFTFPVSGPDSYSSSPTITFNTGDGGSLHAKSTTLTALDPGSYTVAETTLSPYAPQASHPVTISLPDCSASTTFNNSFGPAIAKAAKVTVPAGSESGWTFTLTGPGAPVVDTDGTHAVTATTTGTGLTPFQFTTSASGSPVTSTFELLEGNYTVTETAQQNWDNTGVSEQRNGDTATDQSTAHQCTFSVNYPADADTVFSCTFTNTERSHLTLVKKENGGTPTHSYEFVLKQGSTTVADEYTNGSGNIDFGELPPGSYTLCEVNIPAGTTSSWGTFDAANDRSCGPVTLVAGVDQEIDVNNTFPQGNALTIGYWKNWNTCAKADTAKAAKTGNHLMDEFLPPSLMPDGVTVWSPIALSMYYSVQTSCQGVQVLSSSSSKYAENQLAAQLLAAILNIRAGAHHSATTDQKIAAAVALLTSVHYAGPPSAIIGNNSSYRASATSLATYLNNYNNDFVI